MMMLGRTAGPSGPPVLPRLTQIPYLLILDFFARFWRKKCFTKCTSPLRQRPPPPIRGTSFSRSWAPLCLGLGLGVTRSFRSKARAIADALGRTALHMAVMRGRDKEVEELLDGARNTVDQGEMNSGASMLDIVLEEENEVGGVPLVHAAALPLSASDRIMMLLLEAGFVDTFDETGRTALHRAASMSAPCLSVLLANSDVSNVTIADWLGWTPLHYAVDARQSECVDLLLPHYSDTTSLLKFAITRGAWRQAWQLLQAPHGDEVQLHEHAQNLGVAKQWETVCSTVHFIYAGSLEEVCV